jgi:hypothetical protein
LAIVPNYILATVLFVVVVVIPPAVMIWFIMHGEKRRRQREFEVKLVDQQSVKEVEKERD